jgi:hypothetical protein
MLTPPGIALAVLEHHVGFKGTAWRTQHLGRSQFQVFNMTFFQGLWPAASH